MSEGVLYPRSTRRSVSNFFSPFYLPFFCLPPPETYYVLRRCQSTDPLFFVDIVTSFEGVPPPVPTLNDPSCPPSRSSSCLVCGPVVDVVPLDPLWWSGVVLKITS